MTEKQPSAEAMEAANLWWDQGRFLALRTRADWIGVRDSFAAALDAFAARSRREAIEECADVCRSLIQYSGRNVHSALVQIADQIAALNSDIEMTDKPILDAAIRAFLTAEGLPIVPSNMTWGRLRIVPVLRAALPWDLPAERLEAMARAMYERGPMFQNTSLAWDTFPDYLADRRAVYIADAIAAYHADPIMRELYPEKD